ncbi:MAG: hypothetical protein AAF907_10575, partial [Planctomycetota bacterium]
MTPDPPNSPLDDAPAASGPTEPDKFEPTPPAEPTAPAEPLSPLPPPSEPAAAVPEPPVAAAVATPEPPAAGPVPVEGQVEAAADATVSDGGGEPDATAAAPTNPAAAGPLAARMKGETVEAGEPKPAPEPHVPSVPAEGETGGENLVAAPDAAKPAPLPASPQGISIPKSAELDSELEAAISAGLGDDALSQ